MPLLEQASSKSLLESQQFIESDDNLSLLEKMLIIYTQTIDLEYYVDREASEKVFFCPINCFYAPLRSRYLAFLMFKQDSKISQTLSQNH
jgi:hypothetical protein